jgi:hypothetical protein
MKREKKRKREKKDGTERKTKRKKKSTILPHVYDNVLPVNFLVLMNFTLCFLTCGREYNKFLVKNKQLAVSCSAGLYITLSPLELASRAALLVHIQMLVHLYIRVATARPLLRIVIALVLINSFWTLKCK